MVLHHDPDVRHARAARRATFTVTAWLLGVLGAVATVVGVVILVADDDQTVGLGGPTTSWLVGDIPPAWGPGLLVVGVLALGGAALLGLRSRREAAEAPEGPTSGWPDFFAHAAVFVIVNAFIWLQDVAIGEGLNYALWVTVPWAFGLAAHGVATYENERQAAGTRH